MKVTGEEFEELVTEAISGLPEKFKEKMENIVVVIESLPSQELLRRVVVHEIGHYFGLGEADLRKIERERENKNS